MSPGDTQPRPSNTGETKGKEPDMEAFRAEIAKIKAERIVAFAMHEKFRNEKLAEGKSEAEIDDLWRDDPNHPEIDMIELVQNDVNPNDFTELDATMWYRVIRDKNAIMRSEFEWYRKKIEDEGGNSSRRALAAVLANKNIALSFG